MEGSTPVDNQEHLEATNTTTTTPKSMTIREPLKFQIELLDYPDPSAEAQANSIKKYIFKIRNKF
jgi:hypothetical protein